MTASQGLLEDEDVRRWHENLKGGSEQTARERLRVLARLCRLLETTPAEIVSMVSGPDLKTLEDRLHDFFQEQRKAGRTASYLENYLKVLRSWLDHHGLALRRKFKLGNMRVTSTLMDEQVPTRQQLRDFIMAATPRGRAVISLMAFAGLRPGVLGDFRGMDGLRLKDIPDLDIGRVEFKTSPAMIRVKPELSKVAHPYVTFLGEEGAEHLRRYLRIRMDNGEMLKPDAPVIRCAQGFETKGKRVGARNYGQPFLVTVNIRKDVKEALDKCRWEGRPYVLRRYFESQLFDASWKGLVPRDWITFWAGHEGDIEHVYTLHKGLPPGVIEEMREAFRRAEPFLSTASTLSPTRGQVVYQGVASSEPFQVQVVESREELASVDEREKLRAIVTEILKKDPLVREALKGIFFEE
jgi:hypothetical protein